MSNLPFLNFCLVVFLITLLGIQRSVSVFRPTNGGSVLTNYDTYPTRSDVHHGFGRPAGYLKNLWQRSVVLREWMLEYETINWGRLQAASGAKADLAEARFHVANAEVFDVAMGEAQRANLELERAQNYLLETQPLIVGKLIFTLKSIRQEVEAARVDSQTTGSIDIERYERIKTDLNHMSGML